MAGRKKGSQQKKVKHSKKEVNPETFQPRKLEDLPEADTPVSSPSSETDDELKTIPGRFTPKYNTEESRKIMSAMITSTNLAEEFDFRDPNVGLPVTVDYSESLDCGVPSQRGRVAEQEIMDAQNVSLQSECIRSQMVKDGETLENQMTSLKAGCETAHNRIVLKSLPSDVEGVGRGLWEALRIPIANRPKIATLLREYPIENRCVAYDAIQDFVLATMSGLERSVESDTSIMTCGYFEEHLAKFKLEMLRAVKKEINEGIQAIRSESDDSESESSDSEDDVPCSKVPTHVTPTQGNSRTSQLVSTTSKPLQPSAPRPGLSSSISKKDKPSGSSQGQDIDRPRNNDRIPAEISSSIRLQKLVTPPSDVSEAQGMLSLAQSMLMETDELKALEIQWNDTPQMRQAVFCAVTSRSALLAPLRAHYPRETWTRGVRGLNGIRSVDIPFSFIPFMQEVKRIMDNKALWQDLLVTDAQRKMASSVIRAVILRAVKSLK
ncbi:hypothetical protein [Wenling dimarhabdovirus 8]|uniref:Uncharacterized protein n=1 Tax=Wenling dimarhabdovirus 8 TaxID=2116361 RepID=A0A2P1GMS9_9RHAB|nr:hypothetical protein [Wenling dimarhabdovirus 8]